MFILFVFIVIYYFIVSSHILILLEMLLTICFTVPEKIVNKNIKNLNFFLIELIKSTKYLGILVMNIFSTVRLYFQM